VKKALILLSVVAMLFVVSCGSEPEVTNNEKEINKSGRDLPEWFLFPPQAKDAIYGIGSHQSKDISIAREVAMTRARADIAKQVSVSVQTMLTDYFQEAGVEDDKQSIEMVEKITKEVADIEINGATPEKYYVSDEDIVYVLVKYPLNNFIEEQVAEVFQRNESAAFAEFKSQQALDRLNAEVANNPPASTANAE